MSTRKVGALAGIAYPILQMAAQGLIQVGGIEPAFEAPAAEVLAFFEARSPALFRLGEFLSLVSLLFFLWFLAALWDEMRARSAETSLLPAAGLISGVVAATTLFSGGWSLAMFRLEAGLSPEMARTLFDQGNLAFANSWVALAGLVFAAGLALGRSGDYPAWLGWASPLLALGLLAARWVWTTQIAFLPYVLYWIWLITLGILVYRRAPEKA